MPPILHHPSPNYNARRSGFDRPHYIIVHYTGMESGAAALTRLCHPAAEVSAHYMIEEDGQIIHLVDETMRAWHAGKSLWNGIEDMNSASIGIELVNGGHDFLVNGQLPPYPDEQIQSLITLCIQIMQRWNIPIENILGHSDIAPGRKRDPGEHFPWPAVRAGISDSLKS